MASYQNQSQRAAACYRGPDNAAAPAVAGPDK